MRRVTSAKAETFTESVIREMTREAAKYNAVNLAQGFPDFPTLRQIKHAAKDAIDADVNQYAITWGAKPLRDAIAAKAQWFLGLNVDPETEITVTCGSTEAMLSALLAIVDPGDEVIVFEPFYENYGPDAVLCGAVPRSVMLRPPDWRFSPDELTAAFNAKTKAILVNTPNNPTGHVFTREELRLVADLCLRWNVVAITDEIYEHIVYDGARHIALASLSGMRDRTVTINSLSKTYSVTGWRVGWAIAPPALTSAIRKVHDFVTVGAAAPLQEAGAFALGLPETYYAALAEAYNERRKTLVRALQEAGFRFTVPEGTYYVLADFSSLAHGRDDVEFARWLVRQKGIAVVPGSSFYHEPDLGAKHVRFAFCKRLETLQEAALRLKSLSA